MKGALSALALGILLALGIGVHLPPCPTEDSTWCYWDAAQQGNGQGRSFIVLDHGPIYLPMQLPTLGE